MSQMITPPANSVPPAQRKVAQQDDDRLIALAFVVSLILHGSILYFVYDKALGRVDPNNLIIDEAIYQVRRGDTDAIVEGGIDEPGFGGESHNDGGDPALPTGGGGAGGVPGNGAGAGLPASAGTSQSLLRDGQPTGVGDGPAGKPGRGQSPVVLREITSRQSDRPGSDLPGYRPRAHLPEAVATRLNTARGVDVPFMPGGDGGTSTGVGDGPGGAGDGPSSGPGSVKSLLASGQPGGLGEGGPGAGGGAGGGIGNGLGPGTGGAGGKGPIGRPRIGEPGKPGYGGNGAGRKATTTTPEMPPAPIDFEKIRPAVKWDMPESLDEDFDYQITNYNPLHIASPAPGELTGYFRVDITPKRTARKLRAMPKDVVYIVDVSSSIPQEWVKQVVQGVTDSLASLNEGDRFNIMLFNEKVSLLSSNGILPYNDKNAEAAATFLNAGRSSGFTDVNQAVSRLLVRDVAVERVYNIVLISDGVPTTGVVDTRELLNLVTRDNDLSASIHTITVGYRQNRELLQYLALRNKGSVTFVSTEDEKKAPAAIRDLMSRLRYPIMKDVRLSMLGLDAEQIYPRDIPDIYQGQTVSVFGRYTTPNEFTMRMAGHNGKQAFDFTFKRDIRTAPAGEKRIATDWATWKLHHIYTLIQRRGETPELKAAVDELRKTYGLKTLY